MKRQFFNPRTLISDIEVITQLEQTGIVKTIRRDNIFRQTEVIGESAIEAYDQAMKWVEGAGQKSEENLDKQDKDQIE